MQWVIKIVLFTVSFSAVTSLGIFVLGIPISEMNLGFGNIGFALFGLALVIMFILYDIALTKVVTLYLVKYRQQFRKMLRLNKNK